MNEHVVCFGADNALVGVFTKPAMTATGPLPGFILLNSGIIHRVGPNRLYVKAARRLAAAGYPVLRFDLSGIGDSSARTDTLTFEKSAVSETIEAMRFLKDRMGVEQFILAGICSGADISFMTARESPEVVGAVLINGRGLHGVTDDAGDQLVDQLRQDIQARYLWKSALLNPQSWMKLIRAKVDYGELARLVNYQIRSRLGGRRKPPAAAPGLQADFRTLLDRGVHLLLVYSEGDPGLDYLEIMLGSELQKLTAHDNCGKVILREADHTFTLMQSQDDLIETMWVWANGRWGRV